MMPGKGRRRGSAMLEFALGASMLTLLTAGTYQFGYSYYVYNKLAGSVKNAARFAATQTYNSPNDVPPAAFTQAVSRMVVYGDPAGGTTPLAPGLTTAHVQVTMTFSLGAPSVVTVAVNNYPLNAIFGSITLLSKPRASYPYAGRFSPTA